MTGSGGGDNPDTIDPFSHILTLTRWQYFKAVLGTVFLMPFRAVGVVSVMIMAWILAKIGLAGIPKDKYDSRPFSGWRLALVRIYSYLGLACFWAAGFRVQIRGRQASRNEAPVLVGAPHSSFLESLLIIMCQASPVSRHENKEAFLVSACQAFYQTIFVDRYSN